MPDARKIVFSWILAILAVTPSFAQGGGDREPPAPTGLSGIPFRFGPPGARSLSMGGAFIALADDATASEANPAGLTRLFRPEVSVHGTSSSPSLGVIDLNAVTALSELNRFRSQIDLPPLQGGDRIDNAFADSPRDELSDSSSIVSFASFVKPFDGYTFSAYYQRSADFDAETSFRAFDDGFLDIYQTRQQIGIGLESFGVSAAFKAGDLVSIGFSLRHSQLSLRALQELRVDYFNDVEFQLGGFSGSTLETLQALPLIDFQINRLLIDDTANDITFNVGVLINPKPGAKWSVGLVYKDGGDYEVSGMTESISCLSTNGILLPDDSSDTGEQSFFCNPTTLMGNGAFVESLPLAAQKIKIPDFLGIGLAWQLAPRLKLAIDVNAITYSDLDPGILDDPDAPPELRDRLEELNDEIEFHLGLEYISFLGDGDVPLIVRGGFFTDPDHDGFKEIDSDETIFTFGVGTVIKEKIQVDVAAQLSGPSDAAILSFVYRF